MHLCHECSFSHSRARFFHEQINAKIDAEKVMNKTWKSMENEPQNDPGNNEKSMRFRTPRFLVFCQEYNVKIVFSHDPRYPKCIKNQWKKNVKCDVLIIGGGPSGVAFASIICNSNLNVILIEDDFSLGSKLTKPYERDWFFKTKKYIEKLHKLY